MSEQAHVLKENTDDVSREVVELADALYLLPAEYRQVLDTFAMPINQIGTVEDGTEITLAGRLSDRYPRACWAASDWPRCVPAWPRWRCCPRPVPRR